MGQKVLAYWPVLEDFYQAEVVQICLKGTFYEYVLLIIETLLILLIVYFIQLQLQRPLLTSQQVRASTVNTIQNSSILPSPQTPIPPAQSVTIVSQTPPISATQQHIQHGQTMALNPNPDCRKKTNKPELIKKTWESCQTTTSTTTRRANHNDERSLSRHDQQHNKGST